MDCTGFGLRGGPHRLVRWEALAACDTVVFGGGLYGGGIQGARELTKHFQLLEGKNLTVFTVGLADPKDPSIYEGILKKNFTDEQRARIRFFHFRGGIDYAALGPVHRAMMAMLAAMLRRRPPEQLTGEDRGLLETYGGQVDFSDRASIAPLTQALRNS